MTEEGTIDNDFKTEVRTKIQNRLDEEFQLAKEEKFDVEEWKSPSWEGIKKPELHGKVKDTGVKIANLRKLNHQINQIPSDVTLNP